MSRMDILKALCEQKGISINKLEQELGFKQSSLSKFDSSVPKSDRLYRLAKYFDVPMEIFFEDDYEIPKAPVFEVAAGQGRINDGYSWYTECEQDESEYSYCKIVGDSMYPTLHDGDTVRVHHQSETTPSDYTIVKIDGETATCKFVEVVSDGIWLRAENKEVFEDKFFTIQEVLTLPISIIGVVESLQRSI